MLASKRIWSLVRTITVALVAAGCAQRTSSVAAPGTDRRLAYPPAAKVAQVDDYHGTKVEDPYRWLEDVDSPQTRAWIEAENRLTFDYLDSIPTRSAIRARLTQLWNFEKCNPPFKRGDRYFFSKNDGLQNQNVLYTMTKLGGEHRVLIDPNKFSSDGTVALGGVAISEDGKLAAYGLTTSGSDWQEWKVRDVETGTDLSDHLKWVKFSATSWTRDGKGFFYNRYEEPNEATKMQAVNFSPKLYYHRVGTAQSEDVLVYERPDHKDWFLSGQASDDGRYLIISISQGTDPKNMVFYKDLQEESAPVVELIREFEADYGFIENDGPIFWFRTNLDATRGRIIAIDTTAPDRAHWKEIVPQAEETLGAVNVIDDRFVASYLKDARTVVKIFGLDGSLVREVALPGIGSAGGFSGRRKDRETFYNFASFTTPATVFRYDMATGESTVFHSPKLRFDPSAYETKQVFYRSKDGTRVPMFVTHRKGLALDGTNPTLLYGYGGFNISLTPQFTVPTLVWMEMGGVYAQPNLRGGGEYGESWHEAGTKLRKQNVFDDFIAAAEWLVANGYTSTPKLAIRGHSNGGLLVGACLTQRPDLFGATLPGVGVMDMLRFHKFTIGWAWASDYGSSDDPEQFRAIRAYSPIHNMKPGTRYPSTLITTADHDDRVVPSHSFKFAAALQAAQGGSSPVLIRIETKAGHGAGKPTSKQIEEAADEWAFLTRALKMAPPLGAPEAAPAR